MKSPHGPSLSDCVILRFLRELCCQDAIRLRLESMNRLRAQLDRVRAEINLRYSRSGRRGSGLGTLLEAHIGPCGKSTTVCGRHLSQEAESEQLLWMWRHGGEGSRASEFGVAQCIVFWRGIVLIVMGRRERSSCPEMHAGIGRELPKGLDTSDHRWKGAALVHVRTEGLSWRQYGAAAGHCFSSPPTAKARLTKKNLRFDPVNMSNPRALLASG